jgi:hypothetical protein
MILNLWRSRLLRHIMTHYMTKVCPVMRVFVIESWYSCSGCWRAKKRGTPFHRGDGRASCLGFLYPTWEPCKEHHIGVPGARSKINIGSRWSSCLCIMYYVEVSSCNTISSDQVLLLRLWFQLAFLTLRSILEIDHRGCSYSRGGYRCMLNLPRYFNLSIGLVLG